MTEGTQKTLTVILSEILLLATTWGKLQEFGWLSLKTFLLAGIAAVGSLIFKEAFNWVKNKYF